MLQLNAIVSRVNSTQTDPCGTDSDCSGFKNSSTQTVQVILKNLNN